MEGRNSMTTFKKALKNDLSRVSPAPELLDRVSEMMREEAEKPRVTPFRAGVRSAGTAAAAAVLAFGALRLFGGAEPSVMNESGGADENAGIMPFGDGGSALFGAETASDTAANDDFFSDGAAGAAVPRSMATAAPTAQDTAFDENALAEGAEFAAGGDELGLYSGLSAPSIAAIDTGIIQIVGEEAFEEWRIEKKSAVCPTDLAEEMNLYALIADFPEKREAIRARLTELSEIALANGWEPTLTEEETALLLDGEKDAVSERFASPAAVYHNGKIYSPEWLDTHTVADYTAEAIPPEKIREKLGEILYFSRFLDLNELAEKLGAYLGEPITLPTETPTEGGADDPGIAE